MTNIIGTWLGHRCVHGKVRSRGAQPRSWVQLPREVLLHVLQAANRCFELTAAVHAQRVAQTVQGGPTSDTMASQMGKMLKQQEIHTRETKRLRKSNKKDGASSRASDEDSSFDAVGCLRRCGFSCVHHGNMLQFETLRKLRNAAVKVEKKSKM